jgi:hypothetical protein
MTEVTQTPLDADWRMQNSIDLRMVTIDTEWFYCK